MNKRDNIEIYYTGIGSRDTPDNILQLMKKIAIYLERKGFNLRSGHAPGADIAFEVAIKDSNRKYIYIPWANFDGSKSKLYQISERAMEIAEKYHPYWNNLTLGQKLLIARDGYQVLGSDLNTPSKFVICYTKDGKFSGGTGQALRIASAYKIPIFNLYYDHIRKNIFFKLNIIK